MSGIQVWAVFYDPEAFTEDLYQRALKVIDNLDPEAATRIRKFYRREDACRALIGQLLRRMMLCERGIKPDAMKFAVTKTGKPYIITPILEPPLGFNVTHDNGLIAIAFSSTSQGPQPYNIGIDVMKLRIPGKEPFPSFVRTVGDQLTPREHHLIFSGTSPDQALQRFFWMWTVKEAYTKALGIGLGFNFKRVEFDVEQKLVRVDNAIPLGWRFIMFTLKEGEDIYEGVVAEYLGGNSPTEIIDEQSAPQDWLTRHEAVAFVEQAISRLTS